LHGLQNLRNRRVSDLSAHAEEEGSL
jgi:hypothetical protein